LEAGGRIGGVISYEIAMTFLEEAKGQSQRYITGEMRYYNSEAGTTP